MNRDKLRELLIKNEGKRLKVYKCTAGKNTIGVGRNLDDVGITEDEAELMLNNDIRRLEADLDRDLPWWRELDDNRQIVLADMCFNMGINSLLQFKNTLQAIKEHRYTDAANGIRNSLYAKQVGNRAERNAMIMETGNV